MRGLRGVAVVMIAAAWTPAVARADLTRIAVSGAHGIYTIRADGSDRHQLTDRSAGGPTWSPDAQRIAFVRLLRHGRAQLWTMRSDGSEKHALTHAPGRRTVETTPAWSPDGRSIAFVRVRSQPGSLGGSLLVAGTDGRHARTLVKLNPGRFAWIAAAAWSPDCRRLLYTRVVATRSAGFVSSLWVVNADGSGRRLVANETGYGSFSPDGSRIAAVSTRDRNGSSCGEDECEPAGEIYVMNADGTGAARLTSSRADDEAPAWSPDGGRIAFSSDRNYPDVTIDESYEIYSVKPDGSCLTWLTNGSSSSSQAAWEPGAALSSDPGACGAAARPPLVDTPVPKPPLGHGAQSWWLGRVSPEELLLTDASHGYYSYDDCGGFDPAACPPPVDVGNKWICSKRGFVLGEFNASRLRIVRGALAYSYFEPDSSVQVYTGTTIVSVPPERVDAVVNQLRPANSEQPIQGNLPAPELPDFVWRKLDRVTRAFSGLHSVSGVARALHLRKSEVRDRLAVANRLRALGVTGRAKCPA